MRAKDRITYGKFDDEKTARLMQSKCAQKSTILMLKSKPIVIVNNLMNIDLMVICKALGVGDGHV